MSDDFTQLERDLVAHICAEKGELGGLIARQFAGARFGDRENTGHGFFTHFSVERSAASPISHRGPIGHPVFVLTGVPGGRTLLGGMLWLDADGYLDCIEGYQLSDNNLDLKAFDLSKIGIVPWDGQN